VPLWDPTVLKRILTLAPESAAELRSFLEGFPQRYLQTRMPEQIRDHFQMALQLSASARKFNLRNLRPAARITVISSDRPAALCRIWRYAFAWGNEHRKGRSIFNDAASLWIHFSFPIHPYPGAQTFLEVERLSPKNVLDVVSRKTPIEVLLRGVRRCALRSW